MNCSYHKQISMFFTFAKFPLKSSIEDFSSQLGFFQVELLACPIISVFHLFNSFFSLEHLPWSWALTACKLISQMLTFWLLALGGLKSTQGNLTPVCIIFGNTVKIRFLSEVADFSPLTSRNRFSYLAVNVCFLLGGESTVIKEGLFLM